MKTQALSTSILTMSFAILALAAGGRAQAQAPTTEPTPPPRVAFSETELGRIKLDLSLDHLKLTPDEIRSRDTKPAPSLDVYQNATIAGAARSLKQVYGVSIYHYDETSVPSLADKERTMDSIVRYYTRHVGAFDSANPVAVPGKNTIDLIEGRYMYRASDEERTKRTIVGGRPFLLNTVVPEDERSRKKGRPTSSIHQPLFAASALVAFADAMRQSGLRGLDATVVFLDGDMRELRSKAITEEWGFAEQSGPVIPYRAIYPQNSRLAPIPHPILFISRSASQDDLAAMISAEAPQVYAYNQLFIAGILPSVQEIDAALAKYPKFSAELEARIGKAKAQVRRDKLHNAFMKLSYGLLVAGVGTVTIAGAIANPALTLFIFGILNQ